MLWAGRFLTGLSYPFQEFILNGEVGEHATDTLEFKRLPIQEREVDGVGGT